MGSLGISSSTADPFRLLAELERRGKQCAQGLPAQEEAVEYWNGIGFVLAGQRFVAPMGEVGEILHLPRVTQVPGVKNWMVGIANVRGRLLPVVDLARFFGLPEARSNRDKRVLVVERGEAFSGLIVDAVQGMQYFPVDSHVQQAPQVPSAMQPFIKGQYTRSQDSWALFSPFALVEDPSFMDVAQW